MKRMTLMLTAMVLGAVLMTTACGTGQEGSAEKTKEAQASIEYLCKELKAAAGEAMRTEGSEDIYSELNWKSIEDTFPAKFDLRDRETITPVKNQSPFGTCWSFATRCFSSDCA